MEGFGRGFFQVGGVAFLYISDMVAEEVIPPSMFNFFR